MHELSIAISIVDQVLDEAEKRGRAQVEAVHLRLGILSGVDKDALLFSYSLACEGTLLEGSRLVVEVVPLRVHCPSCDRMHTPDSIQQLFCPHCITPAQQILEGKELEVTAFELAA